MLRKRYRLTSKWYHLRRSFYPKGSKRYHLACILTFALIRSGRTPRVLPRFAQGALEQKAVMRYIVIVLNDYMVLLHSEMVPLGTKAYAFELRGIDGEMHSLKDYSDAKVLVIIFMCNHCPYVQGVWHRLNHLQSVYGSKGVQLIGINPNASNPDYPDDNFEEMKKAPKEFGMNFPYLIDEDQGIAKKYSAICTPDIFVYDESRKLAYRGQLDDNWQHEEAVTTHDLQDAIRSLLHGDKPSEHQHPSMGCSIKWL